MADAAYAILTRPAEEATGNCYLDEDVLREEGVTSLDGYRADPASTRPLQLDVFLRPAPGGAEGRRQRP
ncbi:hypothetical protein ABZ468_27125 [Streptomyces sp. NPDC005708]|uniref:hypothetical protein n=1 Tax=Streptomyces sp. NPDC005708 TaxID=3154564 RepID=UPI0034022D08